jgi:hypothetical protein
MLSQWLRLHPSLPLFLALQPSQECLLPIKLTKIANALNKYIFRTPCTSSLISAAKNRLEVLVGNRFAVPYTLTVSLLEI